MIEIVIMVVVIPIAIGASTVTVRVPPAMGVIPEVLAGFREFVAPMLGLGTLPTMVLDGFMELVARLVDAFLAIIVGASDGSSGETERGHQTLGGQCPANPIHIVHGHSLCCSGIMPGQRGVLPQRAKKEGAGWMPTKEYWQ